MRGYTEGKRKWRGEGGSPLPGWSDRGCALAMASMTRQPESESAAAPADRGLETTAHLVLRARRGDPESTELLMRRFAPALRRWAHGRMPAVARHLADTDDLVQITLFRTLRRMSKLEPGRKGAFFAYLRRTLQNQIRDELRRARRHPSAAVPAGLAARGPTPLEEAIGSERVKAYEGALAKLTDLQQEAVVLRVELGLGYPEIAEILGSPSPNAARMVVSRAIARMAELIHAE